MRIGKLIFAGLILMLLLPTAIHAHTVGRKQMTDTITFGTGCFWCSQAIFERVKGVVSAEAGYSGGKIRNPTYQLVSQGNTGYAEVVQVVYHPDEIGLGKLLEIFWKTHNPTTLNRQGADVGTQYRSVIFFHNEEQKESAEAYKRKLNQAGIWSDSVVTEISPFRNFYPAEKYHQEYYGKNPTAGYCRFAITPKIEKFERVFKDVVKKQ